MGKVSYSLAISLSHPISSSLCHTLSICMHVCIQESGASTSSNDQSCDMHLLGVRGVSGRVVTPQMDVLYVCRQYSLVFILDLSPNMRGVVSERCVWGVVTPQMDVLYVCRQYSLVFILDLSPNMWGVVSERCVWGVLSESFAHGVVSERCVWGVLSESFVHGVVSERGVSGVC